MLDLVSPGILRVLKEDMLLPLGRAKRGCLG